VSTAGTPIVEPSEAETSEQRESQHIILKTTRGLARRSDAGLSLRSQEFDWCTWTWFTFLMLNKKLRARVKLEPGEMCVPVKLQKSLPRDC